MRQWGVGRTRSIAPLYQRLPRGPHHLGPVEVARHQRVRMHGAMVEAVAANGYAGTSVKQVIGLAGVSRRAFYEQFANKQECFLATFDLIAARGVKRINEAYRSSDGDLEQRIRAAVEGFIDEIESNVKGAGLAIVQAQTAGSPGLARLRRATGTLEQMLSSSFAHAPDAGPLPVPIVRGDRRRHARGDVGAPAHGTRRGDPRAERGDRALDAAVPHARHRPPVRAPGGAGARKLGGEAHAPLVRT